MSTITGPWESWGQMTSYSRTMLIVAVLSRLFLVLQISVIIGNNSSEDASFTSYLIFFIASLFWVAYGVIAKNTVLVTSSYIGTIGSLIAMTIVVMYKENKANLL